MSYDYSENILVQESAGNLLRDELGWDVQFAYNTEVLGRDGTFGRESYKEILLLRYFCEALKKLNPWINESQITEAQKVLESRLSTSSLLQVNEEKYFLIRDGIPVTVKKPNGQTETKKAAVIDFQNPDNNYFLAIKELKIYGDLYRRRTDIVGFVNGIPLLFVELKKNTVDVQNAYDDNCTDYQDTIPHLFYYNAFLMLSNGMEAKVGTLGSKYEFFHEWKRLAEEDQGNVALETMLRGICKKENFLDLFENFILYDHSNGHTAKILARNHQYLGVNEAMKAYAARKLNDGKLGVFWHTQGSGKSYSMVLFAQKVRRKFAGSPTFVILTDREELNTQISDTFENCGLLGKTKATQFIATSGDDLVQKLKGNPSFIFTLIQKFNEPNAEPIYPDHDIIIMSDEAHRSQYGIFADNMMKLLPTAARIGFTGTPLLSSDNITARTFGGYVSVYDFKRAVEDGATVPLYYENRGEKIVDLHNPEITEQILNAIESADLNVDQQDKLETEFSTRIIETIAKTKAFLLEHDFELQKLIDAYDFMKLSYLQEAANAVCGIIEDKKTFTTYASELNRLMKYIDRDDITDNTRKEYEAISAIYSELQKKRKHINTTDLMVEINAIISSYVEIQHTPMMVHEEPRRFDISAIDFDLLRREFAKVKKKNLVLKDLDELIQKKLDKMLFTNPDRINYYERYQQIINEYNSEQDRATIEKTFMDLMNLASSMNQEEQRYAREGFNNDEELSLYDMLFREDLSKNDIKKLKEIAAALLQKIKVKISELDHWTDKQETKAAVDNLIRDTLWAELPECYDEMSISTYRQKIYEYVYTRYKEVA